MRYLVLKSSAVEVAPDALKVGVVFLLAFATSQPIVEALSRPDYCLIKVNNVVDIVVTKNAFALYQFDTFL